MKTRHIVSLLQDNYTTVKVEFTTNAALTYTYKVLQSDNYQVGDSAIIETEGTPSKLKVVSIIEVHDVPKIDTDADFDYKWVVQKVDRTQYDTIVENEGKFLLAMQDVERTKKKAEIKDHFIGLLGDDTEAVKLLETAVIDLNKGL
tara:strand:+ start:298 stop:735 length:438 start_codon:yes stop_codon:yes gene_type:complete